VFALPFALAGALLAAQHTAVTWGAIGWILVAMVAARSAAMGSTGWSTREWMRLNPRTANRELPRGAMSMREATILRGRVVRGLRVRPPGA
jgi:4-hydroxybenzoate polyprenyltransferase